MKNFFIHVGFGKAASTLLQNKIFSKHQEINYLGKTQYDYPRWLIEWHYLDDYAFEKNKKLIAEEVKKRCQDSKVNMISSEAFIMYGGCAYSQAKRISEIIPAAMVILVLRNPIDQIISRYRHYVRADKIFLPLEDLLDWDRTPFIFYKRKPIYLPDLFYNETIDFYKKIFGETNLCVLKFEDMVSCPEIFFSKLSDFISIDFHMDDVKKALAKKINESPFDEEVEALRAQNILDLLKTHFPHAAGRLEPEMFRCDTKEHLIDEPLRRRLEEYFKGKCYDYF